MATRNRDCDSHQETAFWGHYRSNGPVVWSEEMSAWLVLSHDAALAVLDHPDLSLAIYEDYRPSPLDLKSSFELDVQSNRTLNLAVASCIGRRNVRLDDITAVCEEVFAEVPIGRSFDFVETVANPISHGLMRRWFGLDEAELAELLALFYYARHEQGAQSRLAAKSLITRRMLALIDQSRIEQRFDLISDLSRAWVKYGVEDKWLVSFLAPIFSSFVDGISGRLLTQTVMQLTKDVQAQADLLLGGWAFARLAALEAARLDPTNEGFPRRAATDLEIEGCRIARGDTLWIVLSAVCRDPAAFVEPGEFRPRRTGRNLAFGHGDHACTGRELSLAVAATALTEMIMSRHMRLSASPNESPRVTGDSGSLCLTLPVVCIVE